VAKWAYRSIVGFALLDRLLTRPECLRDPYLSAVVADPVPLIAHRVLVFQFRILSSRPATISDGDSGRAIGSMRLIRGGRRWFHSGDDGLGFFELDGAEAWRIKHVGHLWDPSGVFLPNGQLLGEISPRDVRIAGVVQARLEPQRRPHAGDAWWKLVSASGQVATISQVGGNMRSRWHVRLDPDLQGPLRVLAAAAAFSCNNQQILDTPE
jgi:hypothetical protein